MLSIGSNAITWNMARLAAISSLVMLLVCSRLPGSCSACRAGQQGGGNDELAQAGPTATGSQGKLHPSCPWPGCHGLILHLLQSAGILKALPPFTETSALPGFRARLPGCPG